MFTSRTAQSRLDVSIVEDQQTGLSEFPTPGENKVSILPHYVDPDELQRQQSESTPEAKELGGLFPTSILNAKKDSLWMPDKMCKVCYNCEDPFTIYRRRHHCRMCGQIFCDRCSSNYIDGSYIPGLGPGLHRSCQMCHDLYMNQTGNDSREPRRHVLDWKAQRYKSQETEGNTDLAREAAEVNRETSLGSDTASVETDESKAAYSSANLSVQNRASEHLVNISHRLIELSTLSYKKDWQKTILELVKEVVGSVDPDVRYGDSIDIRRYVKLKIIPGGSREESQYIDGLVFRKNVTHKNMTGKKGEIKYNPRILVLAGGIEFQRTDSRLTTMDTLIEQEDRYISILVEKIMFLKPNLILVGKAVARKAQELLCEHNVAVVQNINSELLERISRVTGAITLPSSDHMIQQYGEECLGTCHRFYLKSVNDDPERVNTSGRAHAILRNSVPRGCTYIYLDGCPAELGCTLVLRGGHRFELDEVKAILQFCIVAAYHLRLEVAYLQDRRVTLPDKDEQKAQADTANFCSNIEAVDEQDYYSEDDGIVVSSDYEAKALEATKEELVKLSNDYIKSQSRSDLSAEKIETNSLLSKEMRCNLSTSLEVDIGLPYFKELRGLFRKGHSFKRNFKKLNAMEHQTLLFNSLAMNQDKTQKKRTEVLRIGYYSEEDITLGMFLIDNCFCLGQNKTKDVSMNNTILMFSHRTGRLTIQVEKLPGHIQQKEKEVAVVQPYHSHAVISASPKTTITEDGTVPLSAEPNLHNPYYLPITMSSYCKKCQSYTSQDVRLSDETWKMSFGKFMETTFYNSSTRAIKSSCSHCIRNCHILVFKCEGYAANFDFCLFTHSPSM